MPFPNEAARRWLALAAAITLAACGGAPERPRGAGRAARPGRAVADAAPKVGRPYQAGGRTWVPADDRGYDRTGFASWYGAQHRGLPTANGERFDPGGISAAHTTLPLPSYVEVTALATGRTILVRINDRGPFVGGRIIDLSQAAARLLGVEKDGVARVRVRRVYPGEAERAALRAGRPASGRPPASRQELAALMARFGSGGTVLRAATPPLSGGRVVAPMRAAPPTPVLAPVNATMPRHAAAAAGAAFLDMGGFDDPDRADAFASAAGSIGPAAVVGIGAQWRVRIGPYADDAAARSAMARADAAGYHDAHIVRESDRSQEDR